MEPVLEIDGLVKEYGALRALDEVSLRIARGEIFALLGPNGAGKTTLIGAVCGLVRKTSGSIRAFGVDLEANPVAPRADIGLVPQEVNFDPFFTARETLALQLGYFGRRADPRRVQALLDALALAPKADVPTRALSGGMRRRLLIAKALVHRPRLVFLDEPTAGVDVELRRELWTLVRSLRDEGATIVLTTHYLEEAQALAERIAVIDRGRLLVAEPTASLLRRLGERRLEVTFTAPVEATPLGAEGALSEGGQRLVYVERSGGTPAAEALRRLFAAGLPVADVSLAPPKLEDVLLRVLKEGAR